MAKLWENLDLRCPIFEVTNLCRWKYWICWPPCYWCYSQLNSRTHWWPQMNDFISDFCSACLYYHVSDQSYSCTIGEAIHRRQPDKLLHLDFISMQPRAQKRYFTSETCWFQKGFLRFCELVILFLESYCHRVNTLFIWTSYTLQHARVTIKSLRKTSVLQTSPIYFLPIRLPYWASLLILKMLRKLHGTQIVCSTKIVCSTRQSSQVHIAESDEFVTGTFNSSTRKTATTITIVPE